MNNKTHWTQSKPDRHWDSNGNWVNRPSDGAESKMQELLEILSETDTFIAKTCPEAYLVDRTDRMKNIVSEMK